MIYPKPYIDIGYIHAISLETKAIAFSGIFTKMKYYTPNPGWSFIDIDFFFKKCLLKRGFGA